MKDLKFNTHTGICSARSLGNIDNIYDRNIALENRLHNDRYCNLSQTRSPQIIEFENKNLELNVDKSRIPYEHDNPGDPDDPDGHDKNNCKISKIPLSVIIKTKSSWASHELNVIIQIYHYINTKYWTLSIIVILLSTILTIVESIKLIFIDTSNKYLEANNIDEIKHDDNRLLYSITKYSLNWNLACDILSLLTGALITFIMSLIRFNKYQTKLEFISNRLMQLTTYKSNIILMQYKVDNIAYNIQELKAEFLKLEESIYKDSELDKIISKNKEQEFRRSVKKLKDIGPYRNCFMHTLFKYLCCRFRIKEKQYNSQETQTNNSQETQTNNSHSHTNNINKNLIVKISDYV